MVYGTQRADRMGRERGWRARDRGVGHLDRSCATQKKTKSSMSKKLYEKVLERGAIVSEFPIGSHPAPESFPVRNRIIAGMPIMARESDTAGR